MRSNDRPRPPAMPQTGKPDAAALLDWYDRHARVLPWRIAPKQSRSGKRPDPYHVWLSEVMLQQTQVATVRDYFHAFVTRWPNVRDLALAPEEDLLKAWAGLGYYRRARNLKRCAETVWHEHDGHFPGNAAALRELPGIGDYTSAAIAAIAFGEARPVVDGNVERVVSRLHAIGTPPRLAKPEIRAFVEAMLPAERPGDFAQAMMDLGATICTPKKPSCLLCPLAGACDAHVRGEEEAYPVREKKRPKPSRRGAAFVATDASGAVLLRQRGETGLLAGMSEVPTSGWTASRDGETGPQAAPFDATGYGAEWREAGRVSHVFTHFALDLTVWHCRVEERPPVGGWWSPPGELAGEALPTVMKKAIEVAMPNATRKRIQSTPS
ncbi:MAG: A/G-specific adenine glycosylase [Nitratireductor sp.]|nr:A/G-specific adenine glycosylase [Nitratireductor sp.]